MYKIVHPGAVTFCKPHPGARLYISLHPGAYTYTVLHPGAPSYTCTQAQCVHGAVSIGVPLTQKSATGCTAAQSWAARHTRYEEEWNIKVWHDLHNEHIQAGAWSLQAARRRGRHKLGGLGRQEPVRPLLYDQLRKRRGTAELGRNPEERRGPGPEEGTSHSRACGLGSRSSAAGGWRRTTSRLGTRGSTTGEGSGRERWEGGR